MSRSLLAAALSLTFEPNKKMSSMPYKSQIFLRVLFDNRVKFSIFKVLTAFSLPYKSSYLLPHQIISSPNPEGISYQVYLNIFLQYFQYPQGLEVFLALSLIISNLLVLDNMP